ncbi:MAG TPA: transposase [Tepidisphaeraceae bacterium]|jgi:REP element-mobilizing transposase RayT
MPVYMMTAHAYRSWPEDHPRGYVQRREGLKKSLANLAAFRAAKARFNEARFDMDMQMALHEVIPQIADEFEIKLHATATCPNHIHVIYSFSSPACTCGATKHCRRGCAAKVFGENVFVRMKRKMGQRIAQLKQTSGRKWFSRGWDTTPVRNRRHFEYLIREYLPQHEREQGGICRVHE